MNWHRLNRKIHYWGAIACALPVLVVIITGLILQLKKEIAWVQPPTQEGLGKVPMVSFVQLLEAAQASTELQVSSWEDVDRIDVRPDKGIIKVLAKNAWELQLDAMTGEVRQVAYRRSDWIEAMHDGSFFHKHIKLWLFLPCGIVLLVLWLTGIYLFAKPFLLKGRRKVN